MHRVDEDEPFLDSALGDRQLDLRRDVPESHPLRDVEGQVAGG